MAKAKNTKFRAKKDHLIVQNDTRIEIKKGHQIDLEEIPPQFHENLVTEGVIASSEE